MLYTTMTIKEQEYKLRLSANAIVQVEKKLGENPLNIIMRVEEGVIPSVTSLLIILWGALQPYNHEMTLEKVYSLYDDFIEDGKNLMDLVPIILEVFKTSGFMPNKETQEKN